MTAPDRIWIDAWGGNWSPRAGGTQEHEYILHTRAALAASPLVQEIVAEAVKADIGITKQLAAELLQWIDDELWRWPTDTAYADDLARFAAAIRARGEG